MDRLKKVFADCEILQLHIYRYRAFNDEVQELNRRVNAQMLKMIEIREQMEHHLRRYMVNICVVVLAMIMKKAGRMTDRILLDVIKCLSFDYIEGELLGASIYHCCYSGFSKFLRGKIRQEIKNINPANFVEHLSYLKQKEKLEKLHEDHSKCMKKLFTVKGLKCSDEFLCHMVKCHKLHVRKKKAIIGSYEHLKGSDIMLAFLEDLSKTQAGICELEYLCISPSYTPEAKIKFGENIRVLHSRLLDQERKFLASFIGLKRMMFPDV